MHIQGHIKYKRTPKSILFLSNADSKLKSHTQNARSKNPFPGRHFRTHQGLPLANQNFLLKHIIICTIFLSQDASAFTTIFVSSSSKK
jgi:hypothetical protein